MRNLERARCAPCGALRAAGAPSAEPEASDSAAGGRAARAEGSPARKEPRPNPPSPTEDAGPALDDKGRGRAALIGSRAAGKALDTLNRQAAMLIVHHGLKICQNDLVGGFVRVGAAVSAGELVMLLPPNLLLWEEEVDDFNKCLQIGVSAAGERLFSSSITPMDIDNFLCHSCEPNCHFVIGSDLACGLIASRDIPAGESINFDYDDTEDDLRGDRGGFECHCGATLCRKEILGKLYSPPPGGPPPGGASGPPPASQ